MTKYSFTFQNKMPASYSTTVIGIDDEELAANLAYMVDYIIKNLNRDINLSLLDGITIAVDYEDALRNISLGYKAPQPLASNNENVLGVAMAVTVLRAGKFMSHIVFSAERIYQLLNSNNPAFHEVIYMVVHECGHVADHYYSNYSISNPVCTGAEQNWLDKRLKALSEKIWIEYAACRYSAYFGDCKIEDNYRSILMDSLEGSEMHTVKAIDSYRNHGNLEKLINEVGEPILYPFISAAYLIGHLDGSIDQSKNRIIDNPENHFVFNELAYKMGDILRNMWDARTTGKSFSVYDELKNIFIERLKNSGICYHLKDGKPYISIK